MAIELVGAAPVKEGLTIEQLKYRQQQIHKLIDEVLKEGIDDDYARIPGTKKLSLLKPGAEKISNLFQFVPTLRVEEFRDGDDVTFRVTVSLSTISGQLLGEGIGQASTKETKFAWRKAVCEDEYEDSEPENRRKKWFVDNDGNSDIVLQVRENPADKENNMLKIAKKRGFIDVILMVTGCSNVFTQDREDDLEGGGSNGQAKAPAKKAQDLGPIIESKQAGRFYFIWSKDRTPPRTSAEVTLYLKRVCGVDDSRKMPAKFYQEACRWAASNESVPPEKVAAQEQPKRELSHEEKESRAAFDVLGWDDKTQAQFIDKFTPPLGAPPDWKAILGELKITIAKRNDKL